MHPRSIFVGDLYPHEAVDLSVAGQLDVCGLMPQDRAATSRDAAST
jgi:hypothetical protein